MTTCMWQTVSVKATLQNISIVALLILGLAVVNPILAAEPKALDQLTSEHRLTGDLKIELKGVEDELATNIKASLSAFGYTQERILARRRMKLLRDSSAIELQKNGQNGFKGKTTKSKT